MNAPVTDVPDAAAIDAQAADLRQAEYFRRMLHDRYVELGDKIASHQRLLIKYRNRDESSEASRMRRILRDEQRERETVQRMIEALDARFPVRGTVTTSAPTPPAGQTIDPDGRSLLTVSRLRARR